MITSKLQKSERLMNFQVDFTHKAGLKPETLQTPLFQTITRKKKENFTLTPQKPKPKA